ncbi:membrane protein [Gallibacterium salpingitidis]|uniref:Membrane protein n=1 Tax=Gallibacterium salpingitidis TaxID=505341 RepID=A0AB36DZX8_9PAST|nr:porin [Gallibacterium salpingitidis]OBX07259.1 membrane protein [Gallibacterium salpingitidis]
MKKTLVTVAVAALAATSANAAVVYNQDGTKVEVGGQFRVLLSKYSDERADLKNPGSRVEIKATQDLGSGYSALAATQIRFDANDEDSFSDIEAHEVYAGFAQEQIGTLTFGSQATNLDDLGISDYTYDLGDVKQTHNSDKKAAKFRSAEWNGFSFGLDYFFGNAKKYDDKEQNGKGWGGALFYTAEVANDTTLTLNGGFSKVKKFERDTVTNAVIEDYNENAFVVGTELASGPFAVAVDYSEKKAASSYNHQSTLDLSDLATDTVQLQGFYKLRALEVGVKYNYLENAKVYGEYKYYKATARTGEEKATINGFILGTDYWLTKNVVTYVEGGTFKYSQDKNNTVGNLVNTKERDNKIGVGLRVYF